MNDAQPNILAKRLAEAHARIADAARAARRDPGEVALLAASKTQDAASIEAVLWAGHRLFGENRVQEAQMKYPTLRARYPDLQLHLIGPLQTNKVADALALFDAIETLDRPRLAETLAREMARARRRLALFVQVNTGEEPQKAGVWPADADAFIVDCRSKWDLPIVGLMCIPPEDDEPALHFALLREIGRRQGISRLSMGMSGDFATAIQFGATEIRLGTAIFGARA